MRSGFVYLLGRNSVTFLDADNTGHYWSSRGTSTRIDGAAIPSAYNFYFSAGVGPSNGPYDRWYAYPLRCLSTVLDI